jgi:hypothetical protein
MLFSYQKQALTVMISPLCTNCNDITVILLNVALKIWKKGKPKSEKIWKIQKKIVKRYEKYGRK